MFNFFYTLMFCFFAALSTHLVADTQDELDKAQELYDSGDYEKVVPIYKSLLEEEGSSGELLYNLGNSYFRLGEMGPAVAAYLAAKRYLPRDPDVKKNLSYAHSFSQDDLSYERKGYAFSILFAWTKSFTLKEIKLFFLSFWILFVLFLLASHFFAKLSPFKPLFLSGTVLFAFLSLFYFSSSSREEKWGAVVVSSVAVHSGPDESNTTLFELHEGAPLLLRDQQNEWVKAELSDGKKGWLKKSEVLFY